MNIPKKVKVGGKVYSVEITRNIEKGIDCYNAEVSFRDLEIRIAPFAQSVMEVAFIHEMLHAIYCHLGYSEHDEKRIEEMAHALHAVIVDNPEIFSNQ